MFEFPAPKNDAHHPKKQINWKQDIKGFDGMVQRINDPELRAEVRRDAKRKKNAENRKLDVGL